MIQKVFELFTYLQFHLNNFVGQFKFFIRNRPLSFIVCTGRSFSGGSIGKSRGDGRWLTWGALEIINSEVDTYKISQLTVDRPNN